MFSNTNTGVRSNRFILRTEDASISFECDDSLAFLQLEVSILLSDYWISFEFSYKWSLLERWNISTYKRGSWYRKILSYPFKGSSIKIFFYISDGIVLSFISQIAIGFYINDLYGSASFVTLPRDEMNAIFQMEWKLHLSVKHRLNDTPHTGNMVATSQTPFRSPSDGEDQPFTLLDDESVLLRGLNNDARVKWM